MKAYNVDEISHNVALHQCLVHCLLTQNDLQIKKILLYLDIISYDPSMYALDHPKFIVSNIIRNKSLISI